MIPFKEQSYATTNVIPLRVGGGQNNGFLRAVLTYNILHPLPHSTVGFCLNQMGLHTERPWLESSAMPAPSLYTDKCMHIPLV